MNYRERALTREEEAYLAELPSMIAREDARMTAERKEKEAERAAERHPETMKHR